MKLFLRPAVVGLRPARAQVGPVNGRNHSPIEYSLQTVVRVPLFAIFSQPPLPRFLQFPHSSRHLLLPFGTRQGKVRSFGPLSALSPPPSTVPSLIHSVGQRPRRPARQRHAVLPPSTMGASSVCTLNPPPRLPSPQPWFTSGGRLLPSYF